METQKQSWNIRFNSRNPIRVKRRYFIVRIDIYILHNIQIYYIREFRLLHSLVEVYRRFGGKFPSPSEHKASRQRNPLWTVYCFTQGSRNTVTPCAWTTGT